MDILSLSYFLLTAFFLLAVADRNGKSEGCGFDAGSFTIGQPIEQFIGDRRYFVILPFLYNKDHQHDLILSFHGLKGQASDAPFFKEAAHLRTRAIFVFPEGLADSPDGTARRSFNGSGSVGSPGPAGHTCIQSLVQDPLCSYSCQKGGGCLDKCWLTTCADDVGFVQSVLDDISHRFCINMSSVHAIGFSNGGWFVLELGTNVRVAHRFKSIVTIAGVPFRGFNRLPAVLPSTRMLGIYGSSDDLVPAFPNRAGKPDEAIARTGWVFSTWENTTRLWARRLGCVGTLGNHSTLVVPSASPLTCNDYDGCFGTSVSVCTWNGPHAVPPGALDVAWQVFFGTEISAPEPPATEASSALKWAVILAGCLICLALVRRGKRAWTSETIDSGHTLLAS